MGFFQNVKVSWDHPPSASVQAEVVDRVMFSCVTGAHTSITAGNQLTASGPSTHSSMTMASTASQADVLVGHGQCAYIYGNIGSFARPELTLTAVPVRPGQIVYDDDGRELGVMGADGRVRGRDVDHPLAELPARRAMALTGALVREED